VTIYKVIAIFISGVIAVKTLLESHQSHDDHILKVVECVHKKKALAVEEALIRCEREIR